MAKGVIICGLIKKVAENIQIAAMTRQSDLMWCVVVPATPVLPNLTRELGWGRTVPARLTAEKPRGARGDLLAQCLGERRFSNVQGGDPYLFIPDLGDFEIPGGEIPGTSPGSSASLTAVDAIISLLWFCLFLIFTGCCCLTFARAVCCSSPAERFSLCLSNEKQMVGSMWECGLGKLEIKERSWLSAEDLAWISL